MIFYLFTPNPLFCLSGLPPHLEGHLIVRTTKSHRRHAGGVFVRVLPVILRYISFESRAVPSVLDLILASHRVELLDAYVGPPVPKLRVRPPEPGVLLPRPRPVVE